MDRFYHRQADTQGEESTITNSLLTYDRFSLRSTPTPYLAYAIVAVCSYTCRLPILLTWAISFSCIRSTIHYASERRISERFPYFHMMASAFLYAYKPDDQSLPLIRTFHQV